MDETALYKISYGLYVTGAISESGFGGCIVDAVAQVSGGGNPVIILGSMNNSNTNKLIKASGEFTLSILPENINPFIIANFGFQSSRDVDKWANVAHTMKNGLPVLDGAVAYLRCKVVELKELATHTAFFCETADAWHGTNQAKPLIYDDYKRSMKAAAVKAFKAYKDTGALVVGNTIDAAPDASSVPDPPAKAKWQCRLCGYVYEGDVPFEELPDDWKCPLCGAGKDAFEKNG